MLSGYRLVHRLFRSGAGVQDARLTKEEDERRSQCDGIEDAAQEFVAIDFVEHLRRTDTLRFDSRKSQVLFLLRKPPCRLRAICEREERYERNSAGDDALDCEDHTPPCEASKRIECEDC